ncbi:alkaline phosphatase, tissue-nonspecific isozyme-like [Littorina saxatilis]|uniref:alkaline phosphatase, tissue-nonspecific isozyme-like n=1 Tax=Littorina saxatilis TaxID=31220 RepID=UPI0038B65575
MWRTRSSGALLCLLSTLPCVVLRPAEDWNANAQKALAEALQLHHNLGVAKNVILFLGDGMGMSTVTAARIYKGQTNGQPGEETLLNFEKFPHVALSKTYNVDRQTADSAGTATAFLCGVKANMATLGVDSSVLRKQCDKLDTGKVPSILRLFIDVGRSTGIVTTSRLSHATPGAAYAHTPERYWEGDVDMEEVDDLCKRKVKDITAQLVEDNPEIKVILGGGRRTFLPNDTVDPDTQAINSKKGRRDSKNLIEIWKQSKPKSSKSSYVWNKKQFDAVDDSETDFLLGKTPLNNLLLFLFCPLPVMSSHFVVWNSSSDETLRARG